MTPLPLHSLLRFLLSLLSSQSLPLRQRPLSPPPSQPQNLLLRPLLTQYLPPSLLNSPRISPRASLSNLNRHRPPPNRLLTLPY